MVTGFSVSVSKLGAVPIVSVQGEIDIYTCPELNKTVRELLDNGHKNLVLNLENTQYIDSTGLGAIAHAAKRLDESKGVVNVICTKPQICKIFEISGLNKKNIGLFDTEASALEAIS
ncbi:STAS domain-containing protein [Thermoproteota archaeon]